MYNVYIVYIVCILSAPARRGPQLPDGVVKKKTYTGVSNRKSPDSYQHYVVCTALNIRGGLGGGGGGDIRVYQIAIFC